MSKRDPKKSDLKKTRVRFAPSPTGFLHIGGLRTALYNYLFAKKQKGDFILRIEDTDKTRRVPGGTQNIIQTLEAVGLKYDEGPFIGREGEILEKGRYNPYIQSRRLSLYKAHARYLLEKGKTYYCFCTSEELEKMRQEQILKKQTTKYDGRCLNLSAEQINENLKKKIPYVVRLKVPETGETSLEDIIHGKISVKNAILDHQVLIKSDGCPTYHLANVVDDHLMKITHVIRGDEWLPSTPKHILLYNAFGWNAPKFAHLPLLLNPDRSKLSKRQYDISVQDYLDKGYLPSALLNFIALLGWNPKSDQEIYNLKDLISAFDLKRLNKSGAIFNIEKLDWLNGYYIRQLPLNELTKKCLPYLENEKYISLLPGEQGKKFKINATNRAVAYEWIKKVVRVERERMRKLGEITYLTEFFFKDKLLYEAVLLIWKRATALQTKSRLEKLVEFLSKIPEKEFEEKKLEEKVKNFIGENNLGTGEILWPMRAALTGRKASPGPFEVAEILGKEMVLRRIKQAIGKL